MRRLISTSCFIFALLCASDASAQDADVEARSLTHAEAVRLATERNLALLVERMQQQVAELEAREARRPYVPRVFLGPSYSTSPATFVRPPQFTRAVDVEGGLRWSNRYGTDMAVTAAMTPWFDGFAPLPLTSIEASLSQALLRDGWGNGNLVDVADLDVELQRAAFLSALNDFLVQVERAYWELAYAEADVAIKQRSRDRAKQQYEDTKENIERGLIAPGDIFVVEENLVIFEEQLLRSRERLKLASLQLSRLLQLDASAVRAADSLDSLPSPAPPVAKRAVERALQESPRVEVERVALQQADERAKFDANQAQPTLDLNAAVALNGLDENRSQAWRETLSAEFPSVRVGLLFELPVLRGPDTARVERSELQLRQQQKRLEDARSEITYDVRAIVTRLATRVESLELAGRRVELAEKKLDAEQSKYQRGLSTLNDVVRFQRDVDTALIAERRARVDVITLKAELVAAQGVLHRSVDLEVR